MGAGARRTAAGLAASLLLGTLLFPGLAGPPVALASCAEPPPIEQELGPGERVVFIGTVLELASENRWAIVRVEERWYRAAGLPEIVQVRGGPDAGMATSVDRSFERRPYLFFARAGTTFLEDDACSLTQPWHAGLAAFRPAVLEPGPSPADVGGSSSDVPRGSLGGLLAPVFGVTLLLVVALLSIRLLAAMRLAGARRPPRSDEEDDAGP